MLTVKGDLGLMTLSELLQWAEMNQKDGTLIISRDGIHKFFFFQNGKLIYFTSQKNGEKLGEYLMATGQMNHEQLSQALTESKKLEIPFIAYLISEKLYSGETLREILDRLVQKAITDSLEWTSGNFEFRDEIPSLIQNGPVKLNVTQLLFQSSVEHDEADESGQKQLEQILKDIDRKIKSGRINLPPTPDLIGKLNSATQDETVSFLAIGKIIMADQILASKILKVINSPFYGLGSEITSLQRAIGIMGLSSVKSIATAHALSSFSQANEKAIKPVLQHSLLTAFIAKQLAKIASIDSDEAFVCGILHDIGKTILIDYLSQAEVPEELYDTIYNRYHAHVGYLLVREWQLSEIVQQAVLYHHFPSKAENYHKHVLITHYANLAANEEILENQLQPLCNNLRLNESDVSSIFENIDTYKEKVVTLL